MVALYTSFNCILEVNGFCAFEYVYVNPDCCVHLFFWSTVPLTMSTALSAGVFFPPAPPGPIA